jgi:hypothetical protein
MSCFTQALVKLSVMATPVEVHAGLAKDKPGLRKITRDMMAVLVQPFMA